MRNIFQRGTEYLPFVLTGESDALRHYFFSRITEWNVPFMSGEFGTVGLFYDLEQRIKSDIAFNLIPFVVDLALNQIDLESKQCAFWLLFSLVKATRTTEVPRALAKHFNLLQQQASTLAQADTLEAIETHYRHAL